MSNQTADPKTQIAVSPGWHAPPALILVFSFACLLYFGGVPAGLSWAHEGADGGELIAAAVSNGVPHPPGYPLYILMLQGWLKISAMLMPGSDLAWRAALLSAVLAALSVAVTTRVSAYLLRATAFRWGWAAMAGLLWCTSDLLWTQAVIPEVYALHAVAIALLGWGTLVGRGSPLLIAAGIVLGVANHLTIVLLLPAALLYLWQVNHINSPDHFRKLLFASGLGCIAGIMLYVRIPLAASRAENLSAVNWGFADNWEGFWWLVSGQAYRHYLFNFSPGELQGRILQWLLTIDTTVHVARAWACSNRLFHLGCNAAEIAQFCPAMGHPDQHLLCRLLYARQSDLSAARCVANGNLDCMRSFNL